MSGLPPLASDEDISIVLSACQKRRALVSRAGCGQTERYLLNVWQTTFARLQDAVVEHIEAKRRIYRKFGTDGQPIGMEANVTLYEQLDIYVEIQLRGTRIVILAAHSHYTTPLPQ